MNIHFEQSEKKLRVFLYMLVIVAVFSVFVLISNTSGTVDLHLSMPSSLASGQPAYGKVSNMPVAIPAPLSPANEVHKTATSIPSSTPSPLPQAVPAPVPHRP